MSEKAKLSQHTAILLERARRFGISEDAVIAGAASGDTSVLQAAEAEHYGYDDFFTYAKEHGEQLEQAIRDGYRMTFNTNNGLKVWLKEKFDVEAERDFEAEPGRIIGLKLSAADMEYFRSTLASNWVLQEAEAEASSNEDGKRKVNVTIRALLA